MLFPNIANVYVISFVAPWVIWLNTLTGQSTRHLPYTLHRPSLAQLLNNAAVFAFYSLFPVTRQLTKLSKLNCSLFTFER